jgi:hypothetical protein
MGGSMVVWAAISWYSILLVTLLPSWRLTAREYMNRLGNDPDVFPNNDAVFQGNNAPIHTAGTVQSWLEENESELQYLSLPAQSPDLNIIDPLLSVLEIRVRNSFPPPISLRKLEHVVQEEWYKIPLETVQNL